MDILILLMSLIAGFFALAQTRISSFVTFEATSYAGLLVLSITHHIREKGETPEPLLIALVSVCYLLLCIILFWKIQKIRGSDLLSLKGIVQYAPEVSWILIIILIACSSLPPFAPFFWLEQLGKMCSGSPESVIIASTRYVWIVANARIIVTILDTGGNFKPIKINTFVVCSSALLLILFILTLKIIYMG